MDTALLTAVASPRRREILRLLWERDLTAGAIHDAMPDVTFGAPSRSSSRSCSTRGWSSVRPTVSSASIVSAATLLPLWRRCWSRCGPTRSGVSSSRQNLRKRGAGPRRGGAHVHAALDRKRRTDDRICSRTSSGSHAGDSRASRHGVSIFQRHAAMGSVVGRRLLD